MTQSPYLPQQEPRSVNPLGDDGVETSTTNAGALSITKAVSRIVSAGAESRTLAAPSRVGQLKIINMITDGGDVTLACTNVWGNEAKTATFGDVGDNLVLISTDTTKWTLLANPGITIA
jgi:hypothetical protein